MSLISKKIFNKLFFVLFFIIFCFTFKIYNASALVYKESFDINHTIQSGNQSGTLTDGNSNTITYNLVNFTQDDDYDYIVFKFGTYSMSYQEQMGTYCTKWNSTSNGYECASFIGSNGVSIGYTGSIYTTAALYYPNGNYYSPCSMNSDLNNDYFWVCSLVEGHGSPTQFNFAIRNNGNRALYYNVNLNVVKYYYNNDNTELILNQSITNTNLQHIYTQQQQQNQYITQSENGSTTDYQNGVSSLTQSINSQIQSVNDLTQIVLMPVTLFMNLSTDTCTPLHLQVPFVNYSFDLPCMKAIYTQYFGGFYAIFASVLSAITCYWISIRSASLIKDILDCDNDRIEVVDL